MTADYEAIRARHHAISQIVPLLEAIRSIAEIAHRRAVERLPPLARYASRLDDQLAGLAAAAASIPAGALGEARKSILVVVSSERGLCGAFNQRLVQEAMSEVRNRNARGEEVLLCCLGRRGQLLFQQAKQALTYARQLSSFALPPYLEIERIAVDVLDLMESEGCESLSVMYNAPARRFQYRITKKQLFPFEAQSAAGLAPVAAEVKPPDDVEELFTQLVTERVLVDLYQATVESAVSEELARVASMRLAADNAKHLMEELSLEANRARQVTETNALLEIISGSLATPGEPA